MGRSGQCIYKYTQRGRLVRRYESFPQAMRSEKTTRYFLVKAATTAQALNGHLFSYNNRPPVAKKAVLSLKERLASRPAPWEGPDGLFDIDGWALTCQ